MLSPLIFRTVYRIVSEKESRVKESMHMMGLRQFPYWASWLAYFTLINTLTSSIVFGILYWTECFVFTDPLILFLVPWAFGQSVFGLLVITQSFFATAKLAAIIAALVYFGMNSFSSLVDNPAFSTEAKMVGSLSPPVAMLFTVRTLTVFETAEIGITWRNVWDEYEKFSVAHGLLMLAFDFVYLVVIGTYLENALPKKYGRSLGLCCCFTACFGKRKTGTAKTENGQVNSVS